VWSPAVPGVAAWASAVVNSISGQIDQTARDVKHEAQHKLVPGDSPGYRTQGDQRATPHTSGPLSILHRLTAQERDRAALPVTVNCQGRAGGVGRVRVRR
jgi:hypothetical protein